MPQASPATSDKQPKIVTLLLANAVALVNQSCRCLGQPAGHAGGQCPPDLRQSAKPNSG